MPLYSDLGLYGTPSTSYSGLYLSGPYSNHSSLLSSNYRSPVFVKALPRSFPRGYSPHLATISESQSITPIRRKFSPKLLLQHHSSSKFKVPKPIKINTADIDVSVNKYRKYDRKSAEAKRSPEKSKSPSPSTFENKPETEAENNTDNKPIRRDRALVRLHTVHKKDSPRKNNGVAPKSWRQNFYAEELKPEERQKPKKSPGEILMDKFLIRTKEEEERLSAEGKRIPRRQSVRKSGPAKNSCFHEICRAISSDTINEDLNPGQPEEIVRRQSKQFDEDIFKQIRRNSSETLKENVMILEDMLREDNLLLQEDENNNTEFINEKQCETRGSVKRKKKITKKKSNDKLVPENLDVKSNLQRRPTQKKIRRTSTDTSTHSDISMDDDNERAYQEAIRDISQVEVEEIKVKPKSIITATVDIETVPNLKARIDDVEIVESPSYKKPVKKFKYNVVVEIDDSSINPTPSDVDSLPVSKLKVSNSAMAMKREKSKSPAPVEENQSEHDEKEKVQNASQTTKFHKKPNEVHMAQILEDADEDSGSRKKKSDIKSNVALPKIQSIQKTNENIISVSNVENESPKEKITKSLSMSKISEQAKKVIKEPDNGSPKIFNTTSTLEKTKEVVTETLTDLKKTLNNKKVTESQNEKTAQALLASEKAEIMIIPKTGDTQKTTETPKLEENIKSPDISKTKLSDGTKITETKISSPKTPTTPVILDSKNTNKQSETSANEIIQKSNKLLDTQKTESKLREISKVATKLSELPKIATKLPESPKAFIKYPESPKISTKPQEAPKTPSTPKLPEISKILTSSKTTTSKKFIEPKLASKEENKSGENFWEKIGTRESVYLDHRRKNLQQKRHAMLITDALEEEQKEKNLTSNSKMDVKNIKETNALKQKPMVKPKMKKETCEEKKVEMAIKPVVKNIENKTKNATLEKSKSEEKSDISNVPKPKFEEKNNVGKTDTKKVEDNDKKLTILQVSPKIEIMEKVGEKTSPLSPKVKKPEKVEQKAALATPKVEKLEKVEQKNLPTFQKIEKIEKVEGKTALISPKLEHTEKVDQKMTAKVQKVEKLEKSEQETPPASAKVLKKMENEQKVAPASPKVEKLEKFAQNTATKIQKGKKIEEKTPPSSPKETKKPEKVEEKVSSPKPKLIKEKSEEKKDLNDKKALKPKEETKGNKPINQVSEEEMESEKKKKLISKRSLVNKSGVQDPDLEVFVVPEEHLAPKPKEPSPPKFVPLQSNRISQWMHPFKKPEQYNECPVQIYARPKTIRHRHYPGLHGKSVELPKSPSQPSKNDDDDDDDDEDEDDNEEEEEETSSEESGSEETSDEESEYSVDYDEMNDVWGYRKVGASTSSDDSGFDSSSLGNRKNKVSFAPFIFTS